MYDLIESFGRIYVSPMIWIQAFPDGELFQYCDFSSVHLSEEKTHGFTVDKCFGHMITASPMILKMMILKKLKTDT